MEAGSILQPSPTWQTLPSVGGSYLRVPCRSVLLVRFEWEGEKNKFGPTYNRPVYILNAVNRSVAARNEGPVPAVSS